MQERDLGKPPPAWLNVLAWTAIALFTFSQDSVQRASAHLPPLELRMVLLHLTSCWVWAGYTPIIWWLAHRFPLELRMRAIAAHLSAAVALTVFEAGLMTLLLPALGFRQLAFHQRVVNFAAIDIFSYVAVLAIASARRYQARAKRLEGDLLEARLQALESQLRPHFLFNSLNTVASLVRAGESQAAIRAVAALGDVLRGALRKTAAEVALRDELGLAERYLDLERARFGEGLRYSVQADPGTASACVPSLLLQPLVENALEHGRGKDGRAEVQIHAARSGDDLRIEVRDGGSGPQPGAVDGVGLSNTRARLRHLYGDRGRLSLLARPGGGALAVVELPLREVAGG
jgi:two-component sensor histidine kinase